MISSRDINYCPIITPDANINRIPLDCIKVAHGDKASEFNMKIEKDKKDAFQTKPIDQLTEEEVKRYYIETERYDWVTDIKYPEKLFHILRERGIANNITKYGSGERILDLGCGTGLITRHVNCREIIALDINQWAVKKAKSRLEHIKFVVGDAENLPFKSDSFDIIICTDVLEHLLNPKQSLQELHRVMKSGAKLIGTVPSKNIIWKYRKLLTTTCPVSEPFHNNYNISELKSLLANFSIIKIRYGAFGLELFFIGSKGYDT